MSEQQDRLRVRRTWLVGRESARRALVLDFAAGLQPMDASLVAGVEFDGTLAFYEAELPLRALVKERGAAVATVSELGAAADASVGAALRRYAEGLAANPWLVQWPLVLAGARLARRGEGWVLADGAGEAVPIAPRFAAHEQLWRLVSVCGGRACSIVAEWDGEGALPLGAIGVGSGFQDVAPGCAA